jgi:mannose-1-phosphate guanylyltransferase
VQALILVGGEGTRLRPLTSTVPKPVVPLVDQPFITYMLEWLGSHGVDDVVLACGFLPDRMRAVLGDGEQFGMTLHYVVEPEPLGTGGALKFAEDLLQDRFFMLNGDVLTDIDLTAQLAQHERTEATGTLALVAVEDPSAYGLVPLNDDGSVREFREKPGPDEVIDTNLINAGAYILERSVLAEMPPAGTNVSIERDLFPRLVGHGLYGFDVDGAYWLDIGTPDRYLQGTFDILEGNVVTEIGRRLEAAGMALVRDGSAVDGRVVAPAIVGRDCRIAAEAIVGGRAVLGDGVTVGERAHVENAVLLDGVTVEAGARISGSIVGPGCRIGENTHIQGGVVLGEGVIVGADNALEAGARIFPGVHLPDGAITF